MVYHRSERVAEEIKKEISMIIREDVKDPRISEMLSVVKVDVSRDLSHAKIYVSILGSDEEKTETIEGLESAAGFIRRELGKVLQLRHVPELDFILDSSIEYSVHISEKIKQLHEKKR
ncbi:MAG TPA: 30S ribosome-binding factor RbfA [Clostridiales bacterium]|nr:30S ribosome-binding factor RbfA [Clostridiales bacterium]